MRPAPLPVRDGLGPARLRLRGSAGRSGATGDETVSVLEEFRVRFGPSAAAKVLAGEVVCADGTVVDETTILAPGAHVYLYRELPDEVPVPFDIPILHRDDDIVVVDKPHFLATMPRGSHVAQTALVRLRRDLDLPELSPAHRLDRLTAGVLLFTTRREVRGRYQTLFARGLVRKTYLARAGVNPDLTFPTVVRSRIVKWRGHLQADRGAGRAERRDAGGAAIGSRRAVPVDAAHRAHAPAAGAHGITGTADPTTIRCIRASSMCTPMTSPGRFNFWPTASNSMIQSQGPNSASSAGASSI